MNSICSLFTLDRVSSTVYSISYKEIDEEEELESLGYLLESYVDSSL